LSPTIPGYLHDVAKDGNMAFVGKEILNAWYFTCLMYVNT
jgi:hypothetical protein